MSIEELSLLISSSITFKTITPMIPVMFYFLGTQTTSKDLKDTLKNKVTFSFALFFQMFVLPLIGLTLYLVFNSSIGTEPASSFSSGRNSFSPALRPNLRLNSDDSLCQVNDICEILGST